MKNFRRVICLLLTLILLAGQLPPITVQAEDDAQPTEQTLVNTEAEDTQDTEPSEDPEPTEITEPTEDTEPTEETEPTEDTEPSEETEPTEDTEPTEVTEPAEETEPAETTEPAEETLNLPEPPEDSIWTLWKATDYGFDCFERSAQEYPSLTEAAPESADKSTAASAPQIVQAYWDTNTLGQLYVIFDDVVDLNRYDVAYTLYRNGEFFKRGRWSFRINALEANLDFIPHLEESGQYVCKVYLTDNKSSVSQEVCSDTWNFKAPQHRLDVPGGLHWETDETAAWEPVTGARGYYVHWNSQYSNVAGSWFYSGAMNAQTHIPSENYGLTRFWVRALADLRYNRNSTESAPSQARFVGGQLVESREVSFRYPSAFKKDGYVGASSRYDDGWFLSSGEFYSHDLATISMAMSMAAMDTDKETDRGHNIKELMQELGMQEEDIQINYPAPGRDTIGYAIGSKIISLENGPYRLIAVAVRGGGYQAEWASNATVGTGSEHEGFQEAADIIRSGLQSYIGSQCTDDLPLKLWITGYGRAAAAANICAYNIIHAPYGNLDPDDVYAYCFACPNTTRTPAKCGNIFNIVSNADLVPKLTMSLWGYGRYGRDYYLPSPQILSKFSQAQLLCLDSYRELLSSSGIDKSDARAKDAVDLVVDQESTMASIANCLALFGSNPTSYSSSFQAKIRTVLGGLNQTPSLGEVISMLSDPTVLEAAQPEQISFLSQAAALSSSNLSAIKKAHYPELYYAWMCALNGNAHMLQNDPTSRKFVINCPVDVDVYDAAGTLVASIVNDEVQPVPGSYISAYLDANGQKIVVVPGDADYTMVAHATADGKMSCQVQEIDAAADAPTRVVNYYDVPITQGDSLSTSSDSSSLQDGTGKDREPDQILTGSNISRHTVTAAADGEGTVTGGGTFIVGEYAKVSAESAAGSVFAGWYLDGQKVSDEVSYRFRVEDDCDLIARFLPGDAKLTLDREYLAMTVKPGQARPQQVLLTVTPSQWREYVSWSAQCENEAKPAISVDEHGVITALNPGTGYAVAVARFGNYSFTARCRVDVTEGDVGQIITDAFGPTGVELVTTTASCSLYSSNYAVVSILPRLPQNEASAQKNGAASGNNGAAVTGARFTDPETARLFALQVKDDRSLWIVPTDAALSGSPAASYKSTLEVQFGSSTFTTAAPLTLKVTKTLPKLTAKPLTLNSFYTMDSAQPDITGVQVTGLSAAKPLPEWLTLKDGTLQLNSKAPGSASAVVSLLAQAEGWSVSLPFTVKVTVRKTVPALKLSASSVTLQPDFERSQGIQLQLQPKQKKETLSQLNVEKLTAPAGYEIRDFQPDTGSFTLLPTAAPVNGSITLSAGIAGGAQSIPLKLQIKTAKVAIKPAKAKLTMYWAAPYTETVPLSVSPADFRLKDPVIRITDGKGNAVRSNQLTAQLSGENLLISTTEHTSYSAGSSYKVYVSAFKGSPEACVTVSIANPKTNRITSSLKASGSIDLSLPESLITLTSSYTGYVPRGDEEFGFAITCKEGKKVIPDVSKYFNVTMHSDGTIAVTAKEPDKLNPKAQYSFVLGTLTSNMTQTKSAPVRLTVKKSKLTLKLSTSKVTLNSNFDDLAQVQVTAARVPDTLSWQVLDQKTPAPNALKVSYDAHTLTISRGSQAKPGKTYRVSLRAAADQPETVLSVTISGKQATASQKVSGSIDVIRPATGITVSAPVLSGCAGAAGYSRNMRVIAYQGKTQLADVTDWFQFLEKENGTCVIRRASLAAGENHEIKGKQPWDLTLTYMLRTTLTMGKTGKITLPDVKLKLSMGSVKLTPDCKSVSLNPKDRFDTALVELVSSDKALAPITNIRLAGAGSGFAMEHLGGSQLAVSFDGNQPVRGKSATLTLEVFLEGNSSSKANAVIKLKVSTPK